MIVCFTRPTQRSICRRYFFFLLLLLENNTQTKWILLCETITRHDSETRMEYRCICVKKSYFNATRSTFSKERFILTFGKLTNYFISKTRKNNDSWCLMQTYRFSEVFVAVDVVDHLQLSMFLVAEISTRSNATIINNIYQWRRRRSKDTQKHSKHKTKTISNSNDRCRRNTYWWDVGRCSQDCRCTSRRASPPLAADPLAMVDLVCCLSVVDAIDWVDWFVCLFVGGLLFAQE